MRRHAGSRRGNDARSGVQTVSPKWRPEIRVLAWVLLPLGAASAASGSSSSASYVLHSSSLDSAGTTSQGTGYTLSASLGQEATIGVSSSPRYVAQSGFWSFGGSGLAPVVLTAASTPGNPANVDLTWTGSNAPYAVYQSTNCANVFGSLLTWTTANSYLDIAPPAATLVCYSVLATAPGP